MPAPAGQRIGERDLAREQPQVERTESTRRKHLAQEWAAQGRDPETGQYIKKDAEKEAAAAASK